MKPAGGKPPSLAGRFAAAIALTIGFYVLALALVLALIGVPVYAWATHGSFNIWLTIVAVFTGVSILAAIVPRRTPFTPPGPRIDATGQPRLMAVIEQVARDTDEVMPAETYATLEVNAAVTEVSNGFLRGRRRILIIGLPLMHVLTQRGFRGVLAHEFGHYAGGDTRLGPWIWRTRETIGRTIRQLTDDDDDLWDRAVRAPFIWYGNAFLRITNAISRREEFAADAIGARQEGRYAYVEALRRVRALAPGFDHYWAEEVTPVLGAGYRPPLLAGFSGFVGAERIKAAAAEHLERDVAEATSHPYASHPTLAERIAALRDCPAGQPDGSAPAHALLRDEDALERAALAHFGDVDDLTPVAWDEVAERVWLAGYRDIVQQYSDLLDGITDPATLATAIGEREPELAGDPAAALARYLLAASLTLALVRAGWRAEAPPGEPLSVMHGGDRVVPHDVVAALESGEMTHAEWRERTAALGLADLATANRGA